ncbi:hypothetical protein ABEB36_003967 [Hypothenemus hampei]|uniref:Ionotropic glutamate receptor C-terminal domain-containing protein n=1 Tax=Hypothenemus hampei TaxID=57062 RepID=A0ABD1F239_HYPHA
MSLSEILLPTLTTLCLNYTCTDNVNYNEYKRNAPLEKLKEELKNETLVVTTLLNGLLSGYKNVSGTLVGTGVAFDVLHILQKEYGFNYTIKIPEENVFNEEGNDKGIRNMLLKKVADVAAAFLPQQYSDEIEYSRNLDTAQWVVLMKRPGESATGAGLLAPFTQQVWGLIIASLLGVGPILWVIILLRARMCKDDNDIVFSLPSCMWFVYGALLKQGSTLNPRTDSSRILFSTWWIFITILTAFYTANLTAFLTLSKFTLPIEKPGDIIKKHYKWITNKGNGIIEQLSSGNGYAKGLYDEIGYPVSQIDPDKEDILTKYVTRWEYMYIREKTILETIMYDDYKAKTKANVDEEHRCTYVITLFPVCVFARSFAFRPGFKYKPLFDLTIQHLSESGITEFKQRELLPDTTICPLNLRNRERKLRNSDLKMTYLIVGGGLIISTTIFAIELVIHFTKMHRCCKNRLHPDNGFNRSDTLFTISKNYNNKLLSNKKDFVTPPPPYHTLFGQPSVAPGMEYRKRTINGRDYWVINDKFGAKSLIPQRAPSALLFQFTN